MSLNMRTGYLSRSTEKQQSATPHHDSTGDENDETCERNHGSGGGLMQGQVKDSE